MFNLFCMELRQCLADSGGTAHSSGIVSVECDSCNKSVLSLSQDGCMQSWNFRTCKRQEVLQMDCRAVKMRQHEHTRLAAVCCCDHSVRVVDAQQMTTVRFTYMAFTVPFIASWRPVCVPCIAFSLFVSS